MSEARLAVAGVFVSRRAGGHGGPRPCPGAVPHELAAEPRAAPLLGEVIDREAQARFWLGLAGRTVEVLVERGTQRADGAALGLIALQAPDVDGRTLITGARVRRGDLVSAVVRDAVGYDVEAVVATGEA